MKFDTKIDGKQLPITINNLIRYADIWQRFTSENMKKNFNRQYNDFYKDCYALSIKLLTDAMCVGSNIAPFELGDCFFKGIGVEVDGNKALFYLGISKELGCKHAANAIRNIEISDDFMSACTESAEFLISRSQNLGKVLPQGYIDKVRTDFYDFIADNFESFVEEIVDAEYFREISSRLDRIHQIPNYPLLKKIEREVKMKFPPTSDDDDEYTEFDFQAEELYIKGLGQSACEDMSKLNDEQQWTNLKLARVLAGTHKDHNEGDQHCCCDIL
ncbi:MAG: SEL1-like repeat protein [Rickettsiaceae bacterium]